MTLLGLLMSPANIVCDRLGIANEHERGMMRMLVNMLICSGIAIVLVALGWQVFA